MTLNSISDDSLETSVLNALSDITNVYVTVDGIGTPHRIGKSKENSKKVIVCLISRKHCKCALVNENWISQY